MSGGSYNYLCHAYDLEDLLQKQGDLEEMADDLAKLGYAPDAARETTDLLLAIRAFDVRVESHIRRLSPVWKALEWWRSCDTSEEDFKDELQKYRGIGT